jgi:glycosyltransferase involved in cell wall biosynthesis
MVKLYNAADCILLTSGGEGAGLPLLEGAACGAIGITTDYAAGPEYVGPGLTIHPSDYVILNSPGTRYALADIDKTAEALTKIANADREKLAKKARAFAERYSWENVINQYWVPFLRQCEQELFPLISAEGLKTWA